MKKAQSKLFIVAVFARICDSGLVSMQKFYDLVNSIVMDALAMLRSKFD